jgi:hypothetical protein
MKPIYQWIEEMEQPYKAQAVKAISLHPYNSRLTIVKSLPSAILQGFVWGATEQGISYWENIYQGKYPITPLF